MDRGRREDAPGPVDNLGKTYILVIPDRPRVHSDRARMQALRETTSSTPPVRRLSYSSINTYETCPAKFRFQYEERLPTGGSPALTFGDSLHKTLYRFHDRPVPVAPSRPSPFPDSA